LSAPNLHRRRWKESDLAWLAQPARQRAAQARLVWSAQVEGAVQLCDPQLVTTAALLCRVVPPGLADNCSVQQTTATCTACTTPLLRSSAACCMQCAACRILHVACCMYCAACCILHVACCMYCAACRILHVACCMLPKRCVTCTWACAMPYCCMHYC
jgi:hypothetical protein